MMTFFKWFSAIPILCCLVMQVQADDAMAAGFTKIKSDYSVAVTLDRLEAILAKKGMKVFARINHAKGAKGADIALRPTELLIFGNPKVGAPLMACQQTVALDLPQKALAWPLLAALDAARVTCPDRSPWLALLSEYSGKASAEGMKTR